MEKIRFSDCTAEFMQDTFGLTQIWESEMLSHWLSLSESMDIDPLDHKMIVNLRETFFKNGDTWNEIELIEYLVAPLFALVNFNTPYFKMFSERRLSALIGEYELYGEPDAFIAKGTYTPKIPYFCFNEYKRIEESKGDALGQVLAEMLAAQRLNTHPIPIYGIYIVDKLWYFGILNADAYCLTEGHNAAHEPHLYQIFKMLKALKIILIEIAKQDA